MEKKICFISLKIQSVRYKKSCLPLNDRPYEVEESQMTENLLKISQKLIKRIGEGEHTNDLKNILLDKMKGLYGEHYFDMYNQIRMFFEQTNNNHREIAEGKLEGRSIESWLKGKLFDREKEFPGLVSGILTAFQTISDEEDKSHTELDVKNSFDLGILVHYIKQKIENSALSDFLIVNETMIDHMKTSATTLFEGYDQLTNALKSDLNSEEDYDFKELLTVSTLKYLQDSDENSMFKSFDQTQTMTIIDMIYTSVKVAFKVADKSMSSEEAIDFLIDRGVARIASFVQLRCQKMSGDLGSSIGLAIGGMYGPIGSKLGSIIGQSLGNMLGQKGGEIIIEGINRVLPSVKSSLQILTNQTTNKVKEGTNDLLSKFR